MARCSHKSGAGNTLECCREPHTDENHHWHAAWFMRGITEAHRSASRMTGHLLVCAEGAALDGAEAR